MPKWQMQPSSCHKEESKQEQMPFREGMLYLSVIVMTDLSLLYFFQTDPRYSPVPLSPQSPQRSCNILLKFTACKLANPERKTRGDIEATFSSYDVVQF